MAIDLTYVKQNCKEGWKLNPNEKVVNGIIKGINRCQGECPCANDGEDKHCPCSNYREHDKCCCNLYVRDSIKTDCAFLAINGVCKVMAVKPKSCENCLAYHV